MNPNLQHAVDRAQWTRADVEWLVSTRPQAWTFRAPSTVEDGALSALERAPKLWSLSFLGCELSRDNLLSLARLPRLRRLDLKGCRFEPGDFAAFSAELAAGGSAKLSELWLENTAIGDAEMRFVAEVERLRWLVLSGTNVSDASLGSLSRLKKLETLWLERTQVSDEGVLQLAVLPRLSGVPTRDSVCSPDIKDRLFEAQVTQQKSKRPLNEGQGEAAGERLREFLRLFEAWERDVLTRHRDIEAHFRPLRTQSNVLTPEEFQEHRRFMRDISAAKSELARRFCSVHLLARGAGKVRSYRLDEVPSRSELPWLLVDTPSKIKTLFVAPRLLEASGFHDHARRYTMTLEVGEWRVEDVQWWSAGWKRYSL